MSKRVRQRAAACQHPDAVGKLAHRLAYTVGSRCMVRDPEKAACIVGQQFEEFLSFSVERGEFSDASWRDLVTRCINLVDVADAEFEEAA